VEENAKNVAELECMMDKSINVSNFQTNDVRIKELVDQGYHFKNEGNFCKAVLPQRKKPV
jgi:hypothetical protein